MPKFSSDLDEDTRNQITYGEQLMEILKQPLYHPMSMVHQVVVLCIATSHKLIDIPKAQVKEFVDKLFMSGWRAGMRSFWIRSRKTA